MNICLRKIASYNTWNWCQVVWWTRKIRTTESSVLKLFWVRPSINQRITFLLLKILIDLGEVNFYLAGNRMTIRILVDGGGWPDEEKEGHLHSSWFARMYAILLKGILTDERMQEQRSKARNKSSTLGLLRETVSGKMCGKTTMPRQEHA